MPQHRGGRASRGPCTGDGTRHLRRRVPRRSGRLAVVVDDLDVAGIGIERRRRSSPGGSAGARRVGRCRGSRPRSPRGGRRRPWRSRWPGRRCGRARSGCPPRARTSRRRRRSARGRGRRRGARSRRRARRGRRRPRRPGRRRRGSIGGRCAGRADFAVVDRLHCCRRGRAGTAVVVLVRAAGGRPVVAVARLMPARPGRPTARATARRSRCAGRGSPFSCRRGGR